MSQFKEIEDMMKVLETNEKSYKDAGEHGVAAIYTLAMAMVASASMLIYAVTGPHGDS